MQHEFEQRLKGFDVAVSNALKSAGTNSGKQSVASMLSENPLQGRRIGLEKESLRVQKSGSIALSDHPAALGSALCNSNITTDYSEALLEVVTPALPSSAEALSFLEQTHRFIHERLPSDELVWGTSMPCVVGGSNSIRIGDYGSSNLGQMKHIYRRGLGLRYGKPMQTIAGVHFNFSWPLHFWDTWRELESSKPGGSQQSQAQQSLISEGYFSMTRNLLRAGWLIPFLFGASPAICKTFMQGRDPLPGMEVYRDSTYYEPYGTSLRMGDIGYQYDNDNKASINVDYSSLPAYLQGLYQLITTPHKPYAEKGMLDEAGKYQQLNANLLQIENEYYSSVRPKQLVEGDESPLLAMHRRGIMYLELRSVDVDIFKPAGLCGTQLAFLEAFMLWAQLHSSAPISEAETRMINFNMTEVAHRGRTPGLDLQMPAGAVKLTDCATNLLTEIAAAAELLDSGTGGSVYVDAVRQQMSKVEEPDSTPSAMILAEMKSAHSSYFEFAQTKSQQHADTLKQLPVDAAIDALLQQGVAASIAKQAAIEAEMQLPIADYLNNFFNQLNSSELASYSLSDTCS